MKVTHLIQKAELTFSIKSALALSATAAVLALGAALTSSAFAAPNEFAAIHKMEKGASSLVIKNEIKISGENGELPFQDGKPTQEVQFFASPRCYFRLKAGMKSIPSGTHLKVSKIENSYKNGHGQMVFSFEENPAINGMSCYTNYDHSISLQELRGILGPAIHVEMPKSAEETAMNNMAPQKAPLVLAPSNPAISQASW